MEFVQVRVHSMYGNKQHKLGHDNFACTYILYLNKLIKNVEEGFICSINNWFDANNLQAKWQVNVQA